MMTFTAELLGKIIQMVCCIDPQLELWWQVGETIWKSIGSNNWGVISPLSLDEPGPG